jgi:hypothetical protein
MVRQFNMLIINDDELVLRSYSSQVTLGGFKLRSGYPARGPIQPWLNISKCLLAFSIYFACRKIGFCYYERLHLSSAE